MRDDADEPTGRSGDEHGGPTRPSRWTITPGSVDDTYGSRHSDRRARDDGTDYRPRPASEILAEARRAGATAPSRPRRRRASEEPADTPFDPVEPRYERTHPAEPRPAVPAEPTGEHAVAASHVPVASHAPAEESTRLTRHRPRVPEAPPVRVEPDLGEAKELRRNDQIATKPAALLAGFGGVILILLAGAVGAIVDVIFTSKVGLITGITLSIGAFVAALITRKSDLLSVIVAPPIIYALLTALVFMTTSTKLSITTIAGAAIDGFAPMAIATGIAAIIAGIKLITTRNGERR